MKATFKKKTVTLASPYSTPTFFRSKSLKSIPDMSMWKDENRPTKVDAWKEKNKPKR